MINYSNVSVEQIKKEYHLDALCPPNTAQKENIALTIKALYFYEELMRELEKSNDEQLKALHRRTVLTLSYTVIDGIVACLGFKIQNRCYNCKRRCPCFSLSMFQKDAKQNEYDSFKNADKYLKAQKIIYMDKRADDYYNRFRDSRNNIHLSKNAEIITSDSAYSKNNIDYSFRFLNDFIEMLYNNYNAFLNANQCIHNGGK